MNFIAVSHDIDSGMAKLIVIAIFVIFTLIKKAFEWWKANRATLLEKFKRIDVEYARRVLGQSVAEEAMAPPPPPTKPMVRRALSPANAHQSEAHGSIIADTSAPAVSMSSTPRRDHVLSGILGSRDALRRGMILREVFGPPKALQSGDAHVI